MTRLCELPEFPELVAVAAEFHGIANPAIVEKDYYVTEALRIIARSFGDRVIFKGGTSLSKGWKLIHRFSEDIDIYIDPGDRGESARTNLLKEVAASVDQHPMLSIDEARTQRVKGMARATTYRYASLSDISPTLSPIVLLEMGIQSGTFPTENREIRSLLAELLTDRAIHIETDDLEPFVLPVLHFRRTCVEKLYALHDKVERGVLKEGTSIGSYARHYYDVSQMLPLAEVQTMFQHGEFIDIARDYRRLTRLYFPNQLLPREMSLYESRALFPEEDLRAELARAYADQCDTLCYGPYPSFEAILDMFASFRDRLKLSLGHEG